MGQPIKGISAYGEIIEGPITIEEPIVQHEDIEVQVDLLEEEFKDQPTPEMLSITRPEKTEDFSKDPYEKIIKNIMED